MRLARTYVLLAALATTGACAAPPAPRPPTAAAAGAEAAGAEAAERHRRVDAIFAPWQGATTPGCAVAVARDGALDYARGYGMASIEHGVAISPTSVFHAASISKQFTAFSVALLAQEGKLSLDDDVRTYLPELPDYGKKITVAHLIHHTSGLREQGHLLNLAGWRADDLATQGDMLSVITRQRGLNFEPGTEALYNNAEYTLLAVIVERVSGRSLRAFAEERIFRPLGMADTRFQDDHAEIVPRRASAYRQREGGGWRVSVPAFDHYGSTNLLTTVGDLLKWQANLAEGRVGGRALVESLQTSGRLDDGLAIGYGGGLWLDTHRGLRTVGHSGMDAGFRADVVALPERRLAVVALCNGASIVAEELTRQVVDVYLGDRPAPATPPPVDVPASELSALAGVYWSPRSDELVRLEMKDGALRRVGAPRPLVPIGGGVFRAGTSTEEWRFVAPPGGPAGAPGELRIVDFWPTPRVFTRVTAPTPSAADLASFEGQYRIDEVDMIYTVRAAAGKLTVRWQRHPDAPLEAVGGDRFDGGPLGTVTFTRAASGEVDGLTFSTRRLRRLRGQRLAPPRPPAPPRRR